MEKLATKSKILIVDDGYRFRRLLRISLEANDYIVIETENGKNGLLMAAMEHPDVILLDLGLPDMEGLQVLERLREWSSTPIIVLTEGMTKRS
jgi:two-component system KDP operon response regulator KdpE